MTPSALLCAGEDPLGHPDGLRKQSFPGLWIRPIDDSKGPLAQVPACSQQALEDPLGDQTKCGRTFRSPTSDCHQSTRGRPPPVIAINPQEAGLANRNPDADGLPPQNLKRSPPKVELAGLKRDIITPEISTEFE
uniref:Prolactin receptor n=1 Tax=Romanomermis culicivorax TaxID=13658 RepID=A0A915K3J0_ROMCU